MKVYISTDMEGISGVVDWVQVGRGDKGAEYEAARHLLTADVNAAVEGAIAGGADEIVVLDGHGTGRNLVVQELHPGAEYITGSGRTKAMYDLDAGVDAMLLVGYHAMAGKPAAILDHTQSSIAWHNCFLNGQLVGEIGQAAIMAGHYGVPVAFVSGDRAACEEAVALFGDVETAAVKSGLSRTCARILAPSRAHELISAGVTRALRRLGDFKPYVMQPPIEVRIETQNTDTADYFERSGWKRLDGRTVMRVAAAACDIL